MNFSRRAFLKSTIAIPAATSLLSMESQAQIKHGSLDPWIEINPQNLQHNIRAVHKLCSGTPILAVIKNNGYGLGLLNAARAFEPMDAVAGFAVIKFQEALTLRQSGIRKPILLLGPFDRNEIRELAHHDIMPMVYTPLDSVVSDLAKERNKQVSVHVCVDTGIGRVGVPYREAPNLISAIASNPALKIEGIMMTFTEIPEFDREQLNRFASLCTSLDQKRIPFGKRHAASSYSLFQHSDAHLDMVRPGMVLYGIYPTNEFRAVRTIDLRPGVSLKTRVIYVKKLIKGESAGYDRVYMAQNDAWVATLPVGHADGLPRLFAKGGRVRIGRTLYPVVAISASHIILEIGGQESVRAGEVATVFDWQDGSRPEDVAKSCGVSVYDLTMHLNPLLPRVVL